MVNGRDRRIDVLSIANPANPLKVGMVDMSPYGAVVNSVAVHDGLAAVAVEASPKASPGVVVLIDRSLAVVSVVPVGRCRIW